jgi:DNA repair exonuclease SbcCD ATPase subunit
MVIRSISIENWRAIKAVEYVLDDGVNVLKGPNEAGKSSAVEAIEWALYRDIVGGSRIRDEIRPILPAHDPAARPTVALDLEFSDCTVTVTKILADDSSQRVCRLVIRQANAADQNFDQADAQLKLRLLMAADGLQESKRGALDAEILISRQGQASNYVGAEISSAVRSTLTVSEDGSIAPTSRLERIRAEVTKRRTRELFEKLRAVASEAAKKHTEAAQLRQQLEQLRERQREFSRIDNSIDELRATIAKLRERIAELEPRAAAAHERVATLRQQHNAQLIADREVSTLRHEHHMATVARDACQKLVDEVAQLRFRVRQLEQEIATGQAELATAAELVQEWQSKHEAASKTHGELATQLATARELREAWERCWDVCQTKRERDKARRRVQEVEALECEVREKRMAFEALPRCPSRNQIFTWRQQFAALEQLQTEAAQQLDIGLTAESPIAMEWRTDANQIIEANLAAGEMVNMQARQGFVLRITGQLELTVAATGKEARKLAQDIEVRTRTLSTQLTPFGVALDELPEALTVLEQRCGDTEQAQQALQLAEARLQQILAEGETLVQLHGQLTLCEEERERARIACEPWRHLLPTDMTTEQVSSEVARARTAEAGLWNELEAARQTAARALQQYNNEQTRIATLQAHRERSEETLAQTKLRLLEITADGLDDAARADRLEELAAKVLQARLVRDEAINRREALGQEITERDITIATQHAARLADELQALQNELLQRRSDLHHQCDQDPRTELDQLAYDIEVRETELARQEARLRGIAILEAALEAERHRLGRALAEPLNRHLSPWLSEIRGKETHIEFDENGKRITKIRTTTIDGDEQATISLDFASHSGGMQEQTALVLRLILAQLAAQRLPSGRLPIILDDPLTQSDARRRAGLYRVLNEAAQSLQIIFVTCHSDHDSGMAGAKEISVGEPLEAVAEYPSPEPVITVVEPTNLTTRKRSKAETNGQHKGEPETLSLW